MSRRASEGAEQASEACGAEHFDAQKRGGYGYSVTDCGDEDDAGNAVTRTCLNSTSVRVPYGTAATPPPPQRRVTAQTITYAFRPRLLFIFMRTVARRGAPCLRAQRVRRCAAVVVVVVPTSLSHPVARDRTSGNHHPPVHPIVRATTSRKMRSSTPPPVHSFGASQLPVQQSWGAYALVGVSGRGRGEASRE